ncbi:YfgM family protein [Corticibacter populi]|nr:tetratricopeptide repeat protein [Corticibacter populi]RZS35049.1 putative negative regulator of RcsB-dependent stress response [Corticibacter populi]
MAQHYDLQEQEQLATIKHFWQRWGTLLSTVVVLLFAAFAGFNGYQYWKARQSGAAAVLFDQVQLATVQNQRDAALQSLDVLQKSYGKTVQAGQASLLAGKYLADQQDWAAAAQAFEWVRANAGDPGFKALAALHQSAVQIEQQQWDAALATLDGYAFPAEFRGLKEDRRGDVLQQQGKTEQAIAAYNAAYEALDAWSPYRVVVESKLNALGQQPKARPAGAAGA